MPRLIGRGSLLGLAWRASMTGARVAVWTATTGLVGAGAAVRGLRLLARSGELLSTTLRCPRGHRTPAYGVFECARCRAASEMHAFSPCRVCGEGASWIPCPTCRLAIRNPLR